MGIENDIKSLNEQIADLKRDLSNEKNKSCENCIKSKKCKTMDFKRENIIYKY